MPALLPATTTPESQALIDLFSMEDAGFAPAGIPASVFVKSWTMRHIQFQSRPSRRAGGFVPVADWSDGFRCVWVNRAERAIFTYCEGDLDLTIDDTDEAFTRRLASAAEFYGR